MCTCSLYTFTHVPNDFFLCTNVKGSDHSTPIMHWDGAERGLSSSVAEKGEDLVGGRELVL